MHGVLDVLSIRPVASKQPGWMWKGRSFDMFDAFDVDGKGYITADSLVRGFNGRLGGKAPNSGVEPVVELSKEEAEQWIREVDFKGPWGSWERCV